MEPHLEKLVAEHWTSVQAFIGFACTVMIGASGLAMTRGGRPSLTKWNEEIERVARDDAKTKISSALISLASPDVQHKECDNLIAGFDQWRSLQERQKSRARKIARVPYVIMVTLGATGLAYLFWYMFEVNVHKSSATCVGVAAFAFSVAVYDWLSLSYLAYSSGIFPEKPEKPEKKTLPRENT